MMKTCKLVSKTYTVDYMGQRIEVPTEREVFCDVSSISANEFANAGNLGLKPELRIKVWKYEYMGENEVIVDLIPYTIYRTYVDRDGRIELYVEKRVGLDE